MNPFDHKAREWDNNPAHWQRSEAIAAAIQDTLPLKKTMSALEYGAGTGILSFLLSSLLKNITMMDSSRQMVEVMHEKVAQTNHNNLSPLQYDLEQNPEFDQTYDLVFNQMVLHHVVDPEQMLQKFYQLLNPGGYLAIADLFPEDGSFHGPDVKVHLGFDPEQLRENMNNAGFKNTSFSECYRIVRDNGREYPIFLLTGTKY